MTPKKQLRPLPSLLYLSFFCGYCMPGQSSAAMGQHSAGTEQHPSCIGILTLVVFSSRHESAQIYCTNKQHRRGCGRMLYDCTKPVIVCDMYSYYSCWRLYNVHDVRVQSNPPDSRKFPLALSLDFSLLHTAQYTVSPAAP